VRFLSLAREYMPSPADMLRPAESSTGQSRRSWPVPAGGCGVGEERFKEHGGPRKRCRRVGIYSEGEQGCERSGSGLVVSLLAMLILTGGLGCNNAKDTQIFGRGTARSDLKDYDRAIAQRGMIPQEKSHRKWRGRSRVSARPRV